MVPQPQTIINISMQFLKESLVVLGIEPWASFVHVR